MIGYEGIDWNNMNNINWDKFKFEWEYEPDHFFYQGVYGSERRETESFWRHMMSNDLLKEGEWVMFHCEKGTPISHTNFKDSDEDNVHETINTEIRKRMSGEKSDFIDYKQRVYLISWKFQRISFGGAPDPKIHEALEDYSKKYMVNGDIPINKITMDAMEAINKKYTI